MDTNTTSARNTAVGKEVLGTNVTGDDCTAIGYNSLLLTLHLIIQLLVHLLWMIIHHGFDSLSANMAGADSTAIGASSLNSNTTGTNNTALDQEH